MDSTKPTQGLPPADDHSPQGPPPPEVIARGYEADVYDSKTVLSVPLLVILFFVLAFGTVTVIFSLIAYPMAVDDKAHPRAAERNKASLDDRLARIDRDPAKGDGQPRLEPLKRRSGDPRAISRPELPEGNSPELHPEDLRPTKDKFGSLFATEAGKIGIDKTMSLSNERLKELFPVQAAGSNPPNSQHVPTAANAGRGAGESQVVSPQLPTEPKKDEKGNKDKKDEKKDNKKDEKKDNKPPTPPTPPKGGM
jgi:hypothetical protein